ncbi:NAD-binding protein [Bacillus sp. 165]|nr:NAD-binding protein [Bacillus sp. 165]
MGSVVTLCGIIMHYMEPKVFPTFFDGIWWAIVTIFTIGYGDYVPLSFGGKIFAIIMILAGTGLGSYYMISFATQLVNQQYSKIKGEKAFSFTDHIIIVGWNERTRNIVLQMQHLNSAHKLILVDETLPNVPRAFAYLPFIKGSPHQDATFEKANIAHASTILITADQEKNESTADTHSILTILTAKGINPNLYCIVEMTTSEQVENAKRAGADEIVQTNQITGHILTTSLLFPTISTTFLEIYNQLSTTKIQLVDVSDSMDGRLFRDCSQQLLEQHMIVIGVKKNGQNLINPPHPFTVSSTDKFIVLKG